MTHDSFADEPERTDRDILNAASVCGDSKQIALADLEYVLAWLRQSEAPENIIGLQERAADLLVGREILWCDCSSRCGDDGDIDGPGTCKGLPRSREPLVEIVTVRR